MNNTELLGRMIHCREDRRVDEDGRVIDGLGSFAKSGSKGVDEKRIFCQNLSWETTAEILRAYFGVVGEVVNAEIVTTKNGRHLGVGFVEYRDPAHVQIAIEQLNNQELDGRTIVVREYYT
jgi:cold-inducible RNA-binding protein